MEFAQPRAAKQLTSITYLNDHQSEQVNGGVISPRISSLSLLGKGGISSVFNQTGATNIANVGSTGFSLISIGAVYL